MSKNVATQEQPYILVVEDTESAHDDLVRELEKAGLDIINVVGDSKNVNTIDKAFTMIEAECPNLVILDCQLLDGNSTKLVREIGKTNRPLRWIVYSNLWEENDQRSQYERLGITRGVCKYNFTSLVHEIAAIMNEPCLTLPKPFWQAMETIATLDDEILTDITISHIDLYEYCKAHFDQELATLVNKVGDIMVKICKLLGKIDADKVIEPDSYE